jgi:branched-chain amino acid transport system ATP-binding protein
MTELILELEGKGLTKYFGGLPALDNVSFQVAKGEIFGVIGPNGAGKTTLLNLLSGVIQANSGKVFFKGRDVTGMRPHAVCKHGMSRVLQTPSPFLSMTVLENVLVGAMFGGSRRVKPRSALEQAESILGFMGLYNKRDHPTEHLNLHEKRMVELARALASKPEVLLIDEVMSGLNPTEIEDSMRLIRRARDELAVTIIWIEHVMKAIMAAAERVMVLNYGRVIAMGSPGEVTQDNMVIEAYLGRAFGK